MGNIKFLCEFDDDADLEIFYTDYGWSDNLINQIEIDFENKTYAVFCGIENDLNDGDPLFGDEDAVNSTYVSNHAFEVILEGVKSKGFTKIDEFVRYNKSVYYTGTNSGRAYDILVCYEDEKEYHLFSGAKSKDIVCDDDYPIPVCLKKNDFKRKINELGKLGYENTITVDLSDYEYGMWEIFYTNAKFDEYYIDQIEIDNKNKRYKLFIGVDDEVIDGHDIVGNETHSTFVSRSVFEWILESAKAKGYTEIKEQKR